MSNDEIAMMLALNVRNSIEDLHVEVEGFTDDVMCVMNKKVRRAIWEVLELLDGKPMGGYSADLLLAYLKMAIPKYWEPPSELERDMIEKKLTIEQIFWDEERMQGVWVATQEDEEGEVGTLLLVGDGSAIENIELAVDKRGGWDGALHLPHGSEKYVAASLKAEGK